MKVSIITVCYNSADTIISAINSVLSQDYNDIEYIIVDGNSNDRTQDIVESFGSKIDYFVSENDDGLYDAMNKGINISTGEIVGFINSDDFLSHKSIISNIVGHFKLTNAQIVYADTQHIKRDHSNKVTRYWKAGDFSESKYRKGWMPPHSSTYIKKSVYDAYGNFRNDLKIAADYELLLRFIIKHKIKPFYLPEVATLMRVGGISNGSIKNRLKSLYEVYRSWELNNLKVSPLIIIFKPLSKISQFIFK